MWPLGAFLYVLGCREPLPGLHERYVAERWRQVLGSTMHCVAGDGIGILAGAAIGAVLTLPQLADIALEYVLGFGFGWTIFQALFMRDMAGGPYRRSLTSTFMPEFLSMNFKMAGAFGRTLLGFHPGPSTPEFWFVMSMALMVGFIVAFPMNWWLVAKGLKHGMMTVRPRADKKKSAMTMAAPQGRAAAHEAEHAGGQNSGHGAVIGRRRQTKKSPAWRTWQSWCSGSASASRWPSAAIDAAKRNRRASGPAIEMLCEMRSTG